MVDERYIVKKGESGLYNLYKKVGEEYRYQMAFVHQDIAIQSCHLLNLEAMSYDGLNYYFKKTNNELEALRREFLEYKSKHPEDED